MTQTYSISSAETDHCYNYMHCGIAFTMYATRSPSQW